jgi:hypothetical protein
MAKSKGGFSKTQMKALAKDLDSEISKFNRAVKALSNDVDELQKGDEDGPYWNGQLACTWVKSCLAHIDHDKVLLDHLDNCYDYLDTLVNGGSSL